MSERRRAEGEHKGGSSMSRSLAKKRVFTLFLLSGFNLEGNVAAAAAPPKPDPLAAQALLAAMPPRPPPTHTFEGMRATQANV